MMTAFNVTQVIEVLQCADCTMSFGVPRRFETDRRADHKRFFCPAGHINIFHGESTEEKAIRERDMARQKLAQVEDEKREAIAAAEREAKRLVAAAKVETRKLKKRAAAGTCPCCSRSFSNMSEHMKKQHPKFVAAEVNNIVPLKANK